jgi:hypothetical protein
VSPAGVPFPHVVLAAPEPLPEDTQAAIALLDQNARAAREMAG